MTVIFYNRSSQRFPVVQENRDIVWSNDLQALGWRDERRKVFIGNVDSRRRYLADETRFLSGGCVESMLNRTDMVRKHNFWN